MRRRHFITFLSGAAVAWPLGALAQPPPGKLAQIGFLTRKTDASVASQIRFSAAAGPTTVCARQAIRAILV